MQPHKHKLAKKADWYKRILATGLSLSAFSQLIPPPVPANAQALTPANTVINNRATGTYEDPNNPGVQINATSNQVTITVAEVAGLTVVPAGIVDVNLGSISTGDVLYYDFLVTNTGNAANTIFLPATAQITTVGLDTVTLKYQVDLNNDGDFNDAGEGLQSTSLTTGSIAPGASIKVRVVGTVTANLAGDPVKVQYGDTPPNDNSSNTQNQVSTELNIDVRTLGTTSVNGKREAAAFQQTNVAVAVQNQALATILKSQTAYSNNGTLATLTDDLITYGLSLRVESTAPAGSNGLTPAPLAPTANVNIDGTNRNVILISDAIPAFTQLNTTPTAPAGWRAVYSSTTVSTNATAATWTTTAPSFPSATTTRVGFVYDPDNNLATDSPSLPTGSTTSGFSIQVKTTNLPVTGGTISNIAQLFGRTDATTREVYDESGDQNPSNYRDTTGTTNNFCSDTVCDTPGTDAREDVNNGVANPATQGTDNGNNNTGSGSGGEVNIFVISPPGAILNGPNGVPGAVGPNSNNDDFTNKSADLPAANSIPGTTYDPALVTFTNTFQNPASNSTNLDTVKILPQPPANPSDIPNNTTVTITSGAQTATYTYNGSAYTLTSGTALLFNGVTPGTSINYTVAVDLPSGSSLSADRFDLNGQGRAGYDVPIVAFVDNDGNGLFNSAVDTVNNISIDRIYTGYVKLRKQSQVIRNGSPAPGADGTLDVSAKNVQPGDIIRYVVEYVNFSTPVAGSGNVTLNASNLVITEDGSAGGNTWGVNSVHFNSTTVVSGFSQQTSASLGTITFNGAGIPDPTTGTAINVYTNNVGLIAPSATPATFQGLFRFHRRVN